MKPKAHQPSARDGCPCQQQRQGGGAVAEDGGERQDRDLAEEFPEHHLPARQRVGQQQQQRAPLHLADDGVMRQQQGDERQQEDRKAGEADHHHLERPGADPPGGRGAEEGEGQGQRRQAAAWRRRPSGCGCPRGSPCRTINSTAFMARPPCGCAGNGRKARRASAAAPRGRRRVDPRPPGAAAPSSRFEGRDLEHAGADAPRPAAGQSGGRILREGQPQPHRQHGQLRAAPSCCRPRPRGRGRG